MSNNRGPSFLFFFKDIRGQKIFFFKIEGQIWFFQPKLKYIKIRLKTEARFSF